jgi:hypothetical protein
VSDPYSQRLLTEITIWSAVLSFEAD